MLYKWRRIGAFLIDTSIIGMFFQIITSVMLRFFYYSFSNIFYDFFIIVLYMLTYIAVAICFKVICYRLLKNSFGHSILGLKICNDDGTVVVRSSYIKREFLKFYLLFMSLGIYGLYSVYCIVCSKELYHDIKNKSFVK